MKRIVILLLLLIPWQASAAELAGATTATVGQVVSLAVEGEPGFDGAKTVAENLDTFRAWLASTRFQVSSPDGAAGMLTTRTVLLIDAGGIVPETTLEFRGDKPGVYVIAALIPPELALHRVEVGGSFPPQPDDPETPEEPDPPATTKIDRVTYCYEKDSNSVPRPVSAALQQLNAQGILATEFEEDSVSGDGRTPTQYVVALEAARKAGLPALVIQSGDTVVRVVRNPTTSEQVLEAVQ